MAAIGSTTSATEIRLIRWVIVAAPAIATAWATVVELAIAMVWEIVAASATAIAATSAAVTRSIRSAAGTSGNTIQRTAVARPMVIGPPPTGSAAQRAETLSPTANAARAINWAGLAAILAALRVREE